MPVRIKLAAGMKAPDFLMEVVAVCASNVQVSTIDEESFPFVWNRVRDIILTPSGERIAEIGWEREEGYFRYFLATFNQATVWYSRY
jgi:hypothetical protein